MVSKRLRLLLSVALAVATSYSVILYVFSPTKNLCQMTFMMEPPKFIPVAVQDELKIHCHPNTNIDEPYKLYMYSEFGFPMASNIRHDLRDSMPVLFVPGNAGSYQQVRSLASTCIKRQLQSLDAFKFIFYTIDFKTELSAISGELIEQHTSFVYKALRQIIKNHPSQTNGVILIGHSVGGFISKALFTLPGFEPESVPLLISLAGPLTEPYVNFDDKMMEIYTKTTKYWAKNKKQKANKNIAISISGGRSDRLVPTHLSMDSQFDLSITTSSIKEVWVSTDHVSITWCRELMNKLSRLMSALMDRKQTRLISDKQLAMSIIEKELLMRNVDKAPSELFANDSEQKSWKSTKPFTTREFDTYEFISRSQLGESVYIFNLTNSNTKDMIIWIDYIAPIGGNQIIGCRDLLVSGVFVNCIGKVDLIEMAQQFPTRGFDTKKAVIKMKSANHNSMNFIILDFYSPAHTKTPVERLPELVTLQVIDFSNKHKIYMPSLFEFIISKFLPLSSLDTLVIKRHIEKLPVIYSRVGISNFKQKTQLLSLKHETRDCLSVKHQLGPTISLYQNGYFMESFHPDIETNSISQIRVNSVGNLIPTIQKENGAELYLELFVPGNCNHLVSIELNMMDIVFWIIQKNMVQVLTAATYLAYSSVILYTLDLGQNTRNRRTDKTNSSRLFNFIGFVLNQILTDNITYSFITSTYWTKELELSLWLVLDVLTAWGLVYLSALGILCCLEFNIKRLIDVAFLLDRAQSQLRLIVGRLMNNIEDNRGINGTDKLTESNDEIKSGEQNHNNLRAKVADDETFGLDFDWPLIGVTIAGSIVISPALLSTFSLFILIKLGLCIAVSRRETIECSDPKSKASSDTVGEHTDRVHGVVVSLAALCSLALVSNIPVALLRLRSSGPVSSLVLYNNPTFLSSVFSLLLVKVICEIIQLNYLDIMKRKHVTISTSAKDRQFTFRNLWWRFSRLLPTRYTHLIALAPIVFVGTNICHINHVLFVSLLWVDCYLLSRAG